MCVYIWIGEEVLQPESLQHGLLNFISCDWLGKSEVRKGGYETEVGEFESSTFL